MPISKLAISNSLKNYLVWVGKFNGIIVIKFMSYINPIIPNTKFKPIPWKSANAPLATTLAIILFSTIDGYFGYFSSFAMIKIEVSTLSVVSERL